MKKALVLFWVILSVGYVSAFDFEAGGIYYKVTAADEVAVTTGEQPYEGYVKIPDEVSWQGNSYQVTAIDHNTFRECTKLVGAALPRHLRSIGDYAFFDCDQIYYISFPDGLETIGESAFYGCNSLSTVNIPASVSTIGAEAFLRCRSLFSFKVSDGNATYSSPDGVLMDLSQSTLIAYPNAKGSDYVVPSSVTTVSDMAFVGCENLKSVSLPAQLLHIGDAAFYGCKQLSSISIPSSVSTIGDWTFAECDQLSSVVLGSGVHEIGVGAFSFCPRLQFIRTDAANTSYCTVGDVLLSKDQHTIIACPGAKAGSYRLPATVTALKTSAFFGCNSLSSVILPTSLSNLGDNPFVFCDGLKEILVSTGHPDLTSEDGVLMNKDRTAVLFYPNAREGAYAIPNGVTSLTNGTFVWSHQLTDVTVPTSVTSIGDWTFLGCQTLRSISVPASVATIGKGAFLDCSALSTIICSGSPMPTTAFDANNYGNASLYVPKGMVDQYRQTPGWDAFSSINPFGLYVNDQSVKRGQCYNLPICAAGPLQLTSLQFDLVLPEGLEMAADAAGNYVVTPATEQGYALSCTKIDGQRYRITMTSSDTQPLETSAEGDALLFVGICGDADGQEGMLDMLVKDISLEFEHDIHDGEARQPDLSAVVSVQLFLGDVNGNGRLNVADLVETYRYIANNPSSKFHIAEADINRSGEVNTADAKQLINMLTDENMTALPEWYWSKDISSDILSAEDLTMGRGVQAPLNINLTNSTGNYTALAFKLVLPPGVTIVQEDGRIPYRLSQRFTDNMQPCYVVEAGSDEAGTAYLVMSASPAISTITGNSGLLLTLPLIASEDAAIGTCTGKLQAITFADVNAEEYAFDDTAFTIHLNENTAVTEVHADVQEQAGAIYNLAGQRVTHPTQGIYIINGKKIAVKR